MTIPRKNPDSMAELAQRTSWRMNGLDNARSIDENVCDEQSAAHLESLGSGPLRIDRGLGSPVNPIAMVWALRRI
jgi:hypothetical protein